ncbi:MAG: MATE family efflux transporter [Suipraeoptans sp.]
MKFTKTQTSSIQFNKRLFYGQVFALTLPMALQNLINVGVTATDVLMLGRVSEVSLSGASLGGQIQFIMTLILMGITSGATVLSAQYWGKRDIKAIEKILGMSLFFGVAVSLLFSIMALTIPQYLMRIFSNEQDVIAEGVKYLRIVGISYIFASVAQVYLYVMRSIEKVIIATFVYLISLMINFTVNAVLIFGLFGAPRMGVQGAAIGTLIARIIEFTIVFVYAKYKNDIIKVRFKYIFKIDKPLLRDFMVYSLPVVMNELFWGGGTSANTAIIGHMGSAAVAANSVVQVTRQLSMVITFGIANATAIIIGKTIGEKKIALAKAYGHQFLKMTVVLGIAGAGIILIISPIARATLALSPQTMEYLEIMFIVMAYFAFCQAINSTLVVGVFRAGGDTKFGLILDVTSMWCCSILIGFIAAFVLKLSVPVVYVILLSDEVIKLPFTLKRYFGYKWLRDVTREEVN